MLLGRRSECEELDRLLDAVRAGESRVLVVRGEAGLGKTALLEYAIERASGCRVARAAGVESEMELPFATLHQWCAPMLDRLERLPDPQRDALSVAFGLSAGDAPNRFLVGLAALSLLSEVATEQPLVCVVDDAQWLDEASAQTLAFVARRLVAESVAIICATREPSADCRELQELILEGLPADDARALLGSVIRGPIDERVRDRIIAETRGNPLALLELPRGLTSAELGLPDALPLSKRIEESFRRRVEALPNATQRLLVVAAAEPVGEPALVWRAAERLGIGVEAAAPATDSGLLELGASVRFRHPLVRSAAYQAASLGERQLAHGALAEATDPEVDPDRRAWHRGHAALGPDEDVAEELERAAGRAQARGGLAAGAALLERAAALTLVPARRAERALAAAQAKHQAGAPDAALELLGTASAAGSLDELQRARVDLLRAQIAFAVGRGSDAPPLLLKAAKQLEPLDVALARETYLEAFVGALFAGRLATHGGLREAAEAVRALPPAQPPRPSDLLLDRFALLVTEGYAAGAVMLKRALSAFHGEEGSRDEGIRRLWLGAHAATQVWDDESWHEIVGRQVQLSREAGALPVLPIALTARIDLHLFAGEFREAASLIAELEALTDGTGRHLVLYSALPLAAWQGRADEVGELVDAIMKDSVAKGRGIGLSITYWTSGVLYNGLGQYEDALTAAAPAADYPHDGFWALPELIEAASRVGKAEPADDALRRLSEMTSASRTDWGLGIEARSRALLSDGAAAERLYRDAIARLGRTRMRVELARAHLLYGEWLRRERRRREAREQLRTAHEMFASFGAMAFAERAARELLATGETARRRTVDTSGQLTAQEAQIAGLARDGHSNPEIGGQLFISPRTVQYHLHKVFAKLDISSRTELDRALPIEASAIQQA